MPAYATCIRTRRLLATLAVTAALAALAMTGCSKPAATSSSPAASAPAPGSAPPAQPGGAGSQATSATSSAAAATTVPPVPMTAVKVYLVREEFLGVGSARMVPAVTPARGAMLALLAGPTPAEKVWGLHSEIPSGTKLLGLNVAGGVATVDLSKRFASGGGTVAVTLRIAQVVNTLTQFNGVNRVAFRIGGKPVSSIGGEGITVSPPVARSDFAGAWPAIMLESPLPDATLKSPIRVRGSADVFEAQFTARVADAAGKVVGEVPIKATSGTGTRGTFDALIPFKPTKHGKGWLIVFQPSAKGGEPTNVVKIRIHL